MSKPSFSYKACNLVSGGKDNSWIPCNSWEGAKNWLLKEVITTSAIPSITIYGDGEWFKTLHKYNYNAMSDVPISIGKATGKLLHIGV